MVQVLQQPFNPNGYNLTDPGVVHCKAGCEEKLYSGALYCNHVCRGEYKCSKLCKDIGFDRHVYCLTDEFGPNEYSQTRIINGIYPAIKTSCLKDYASLVRHRVEKMFPIELLKRLCGQRSPPKQTGLLSIDLLLENNRKILIISCYSIK